MISKVSVDSSAITINWVYFSGGKRTNNGSLDLAWTTILLIANSQQPTANSQQPSQATRACICWRARVRLVWAIRRNTLIIAKCHLSFAPAQDGTSVRMSLFVISCLIVLYCNLPHFWEFLCSTLDLYWGFQFKRPWEQVIHLEMFEQKLAWRLRLCLGYASGRPREEPRGHVRDSFFCFCDSAWCFSGRASPAGALACVVFVSIRSV